MEACPRVLLTSALRSREVLESGGLSPGLALTLVTLGESPHSSKLPFPHPPWEVGDLGEVTSPWVGPQPKEPPMCARTESSLHLRSGGRWACLSAVIVRDSVGGQMMKMPTTALRRVGSPLDTFSACCPAVGPLRASTCSFLASALLLDWLPFPMAWGVWSFREKPQQGQLQ